MDVNKLKEVKLFLGPQHPGMHGNYSVHMYVDGDIIKKARPMPGMLHRGFEKLMERKLWMSNTALIPRICVIEPDINEMVSWIEAFVMLNCKEVQNITFSWGPDAV